MTNAGRTPGVFAFHECLQPVVKSRVFHAIVVFCEDVRNRVRELVRLTEYWPFLSKTWGESGGPNRTNKPARIVNAAGCEKRD